MIESLTQAQIDRFPEFGEKWTKICFCTDPANRREAEEAIRQSCVLAGLVPPEEIVWRGSPLSIIDAIFKDKSLSDIAVSNFVKSSANNSVSSSAWRSVNGSIRDSVWRSVNGSSIRDSVWRYVNGSIRDSVWRYVNGSSIRDSAWRSVNDSVSNFVWDSVNDSIMDSVKNFLWAHFCYGQHDAFWLAYYDYLREVVGLREETEKITGLIEVAKHAGCWWLPYEKVCFVSERHNFLSFDARGRPHSLSGPAITYPDGWKIYSVHGATVPEQLILAPESQTIQEIQEEKNIEVRRIRIERYGWLSYLRMIDAKMLDRRKNEVEGTNEALMRTPHSKVLVCACPSTARVYALEVPYEINSCEQAQNWLSGGLNGRITAAT